MKLLDPLLFASDAELSLVAGAAVLLLAALTRYAETRRLKRARIDRVGWMPWTGLFLVLSIAGITLVGLGVIGLLKG